MITKQDLQEAIAECEGQRNPNATTCIKLAAFYTIQQHMFGEEPNAFSFASAPRMMNTAEEPSFTYNSGTEFATVIADMKIDDVLSVMDELMSTLNVVNPRLYASVMRKLRAS